MVAEVPERARIAIGTTTRVASARRQSATNRITEEAATAVAATIPSGIAWARKISSASTSSAIVFFSAPERRREKNPSGSRASASETLIRTRYRMVYAAMCDTHIEAAKSTARATIAATVSAP